MVTSVTSEAPSSAFMLVIISKLISFIQYVPDV